MMMIIMMIITMVLILLTCKITRTIIIINHYQNYRHLLSLLSSSLPLLSLLSSSSILDTALEAIASSTPKPNLKSRLLKRKTSTDLDTTTSRADSDTTRRVGITISPNIKSSSIDDHNANVINDVKVLLPLL